MINDHAYCDYHETKPINVVTSHRYIMQVRCSFLRFRVLFEMLYTVTIGYYKRLNGTDFYCRIWLYEYDCMTCSPTKFPDSKDHGANTGPTLVLSAPGRPHVGTMNIVIMVGCPLHQGICGHQFTGSHINVVPVTWSEYVAIKQNKLTRESISMRFRLIHLPLDEIADISQTLFSDAFS